MLERLKAWARTIRRDTHALYLGARDPRVPWYAKAFGLAVAAYALSPIDLIPDFIPVVGLLDEAILLPLAIVVAVRLIPRELMAEHRRAAAAALDQPASRASLVAVVAIWMILALLGGLAAYRWLF